MAKITKTIEAPMYYGASSLIMNRAKELRKNQTEAEKRMWEILGSKKILGLHFRRQHPIGSYIADFYCHALKLVIEIDGEIHDKKEVKENDENRTAEMERYDLKILRFSNLKVFHDLETVQSTIERECRKLLC